MKKDMDRGSIMLFALLIVVVIMAYVTWKLQHASSIALKNAIETQVVDKVTHLKNSIETLLRMQTG
jgi:hypothetical protein